MLNKSMPLRLMPLLFSLALVISNGCASAATTLNLVTSNDPGVRVAARDISYGKGERQKLDVYVPETQKDGNPVMVFVYGGNWASGSKKDYEFAGYAFAARGFVTVVIDYRLVPDVGYPAFVDDTATSVRWVKDNIKNYGGDPDLLFISGHSAGAYNAIMVSLAPEFLAQHDLTPDAIAGVIGISGPYGFLPLSHPVTQDAFGAAEDLESTQPINRVTATGPPTLLLSGSEDTTVPPRNVTVLGEVFKDAGRRVETKIYPGLDHAGAVMALSVLFRGKAPILEDIVVFTRRERVLLEDQKK